MISTDGIDEIVSNGGIVVTSDGIRIGSVEQVFLRADTNKPAFVTVRTGLFGMQESFVSLSGAHIDGSRVLVAFDRAQIRGGPRIESDRGDITSDEEATLYDYFGVNGDSSAAPSSDDASTAAGTGTGLTTTTADAATGPTPQPPPPPAPHRPTARQPPPPPPHHPPPPPHLLKHVVDPHRQAPPPLPPHHLPGRGPERGPLI